VKRKFYLDTAIWRDYFEDRRDCLQPLGEFAFQFLKNCEKEGCEVLYSELVTRELLAYYSEERVKQVFSSFSGILRLVEITKEQADEVKIIRNKTPGAHNADILHAIIACDNEAILITRDRHFEALTGIVRVLKPEEVTFF